VEANPVAKLPPADADELLRLLRERGRANLTVQARGPHLVIHAGGGPRARLTRLSADQYGLSLPTANGRWESLPFAGSLAAVVADLHEHFGFHLDPDPTG
jgi:hypothetical protein